MAWGATFHGTSHTLLRIYQWEREERLRSLLPMIQYFSFRFLDTGLRGLGVNFSGWGLVDLLEISRNDRLDGDLSLLYVDYRQPKGWFGARLGRQYVYLGPRAAAHIDGLKGVVRLPGRLLLQVYGGITVAPYFNPWPGRWMGGARLSHQWRGLDLGLAFYHVQGDNAPERQALSLDLAWRILPWLEVSGAASLDLVAIDLQEATVLLTLRPTHSFRITVDYDHTLPAAYIDKTSIFSVFSSSTYDAVGAIVSWTPQRRLNLWASYHHYFFGEGGDGQKGEVNLRVRMSPKGRHFVGLTGARLREEESGYWRVRLFYLLRQGKSFHAGLDLQADLYDEAINDQGYGAAARLHATFRFASRLSLSAAITLGTSPLARQEVAGVLRLTYLLGRLPHPAFRGATW